jgi:hypothetical protein
MSFIWLQLVLGQYMPMWIYLAPTWSAYHLFWQKLDQTCLGNLLSFQIEYQTGINTYQFYMYMYGINSCNFNFWYQEVVNTSLICWNSYDTYGPHWENSMKQICFLSKHETTIRLLDESHWIKIWNTKILSTTPPTLFCIKYAHSLNRYCAETTPKNPTCTINTNIKRIHVHNS